MKRNVCFIMMSFLSFVAACLIMYTEEMGAGHHAGILLPVSLSAIMALGSLALKAFSQR